MCILMVTGIEGARNCAAVVAAQLGMEVEVAEGRKTALRRCATGSFWPWCWMRPWRSATRRRRGGLGACRPGHPVQINFALSGSARLIREIRAALHRREREQTLARRAAAAAIEIELNPR